MTDFPVLFTRLLQQLKPYKFADDVTVRDIVDRTWKKFIETNLEYYVKLPRHSLIEVAIMQKKAWTRMEENIPPVEGELDPREVYLKEMRLFLLQDLMFVKNHFNQMAEILENGWETLSDMQRFVFYIRVVEDAESNKFTIIKEPKYTTDMKYESPEYWDNHSYTNLINETDCLAFSEYANITQSRSIAPISPPDMWMRWMQLSVEEQDKFYQKVPKLYASILAKNAFMEEKSTLKPGNDGYCNQQCELSESWKLLGDDVKKYYAGNAYEKRLKYEANPENRFIGKLNDRKSVSNITTFDDINSQLTPIPPFSFVSSINDEETNGILLFMEMHRSELIKDPEVAKMRYWAVNVLLFNKWHLELKEQDKKRYHNIANRFIEINENLHERQINAMDIYLQETKDQLDESHDYAIIDLWNNVDAETKKTCGKMTLENRKVLLRHYPDLYDYYVWTRSDTILYKISLIKESTETKKPPTAFMFFKKTMRRNLKNESFGKKDNLLQRNILISSWKNLGDEAKAVYFEKERLACIQFQRKQLLLI